MKTDIHPDYREATVRCTCGNEFVTRSVAGDLHVEICSNCHPFYTGKQKLMDTGGRVERFQRKLAKSGGRSKADIPSAPPRSSDLNRAGLSSRAGLPITLWVSSPEQRDAPVGGQAVLEGVMMRGVSTWAVATRKDGEIAVESHPVVSWVSRSKVLRWPVIRGVVALAQSMSIGFKALEISANAQEPEGAEPISKSIWAFTIVAALALAVGLFFLVPFGLTYLIKGWLGESSVLFWLVEGVRAHRDLPRLPHAALAPARPAAAVPVPRRRAQGHLDLRGRPAADGRRTPSRSAACTRAAARASCSW